jgi:molybdenum cofactor cytidylyltransferase
MLLEVQGESVIDRAVAAVAGACSSVIVVLGHDAEAVRAAVCRPVRFVRNPRPEDGQLSSLQCGLRAVPAEAESVVYLPGDYPCVRPDTVARLLAERGSGPLAIPRCDGRNGHPVVIGRELIGEFLAETVSAREVVHRHSANAVYVDTDDPGVLRDLDTPADYAEAIR